MIDMKASVELNDHLRNHVQHLLQTHELYLIQWESRLNKNLALCRKRNLNCDRFSGFYDHGGNGVTAEQPTTFDEHPFKLANLEQ